MRRLVYLAAAVALLASLPGHADTTLIYNAGNNPFKIRVRPGEIRIDDSSDRWQLYRQDEGAIYSVDPAQKTYVRMDADTAGAIRAQMARLRKTMDAKLAQLNPNQRAAARAALADQIPGLDAQGKAEIETTGRTDSVAGHDCKVVNVQRNGETRQTLCVAGRKALGLSDAEFGTVESMFSLMHSMLAGTGLEYVGLPYLKLNGVPIRYRDLRGGSTRTLSRITRASLPALVFQIPPSYRARRPSAAR